MLEERDSNTTGDGQIQLQNTGAVRKKRTAPSNPATVSPKPNQRKVSQAQASTSSVNPEHIPADITHAPLILKRDSQFYAEGSLSPASSQQGTPRLKSSLVIKSSPITDIMECALSMHVICSSCKKFYSVTNQPYVHKCGMSICKECNSKKTTDCESCRGEEHRRSNHTAILNKDLENNLSLIFLKFQTIDFLGGLSESISVWDDVSENIDIYSNLFKNMDGTIDLELTDKENLEKYINLIYMLKNLRSIVEKIDDKDVKNFKAAESEVGELLKNLIPIDCVLYDIFDKITPMMDIHIGLRIKNFSRKNQFMSPSKDLVCYAISERKKKYFPFQFRDSSLYVRSCVDILKFENKSLVVDYECLDHIYSRAGVFFELEYKEQTININVNLSPISSLQARQISLLCTGEEGPCYKAGQGISTERDILLKTYKDGGLLKSEDIIPNIPDNLGSNFIRVKGIAAIDRIYGKGASIRICLTDEESTPDEASSFTIGHVMDTETLNNIPTGSFKVKDCGLIYVNF